MLNGIFVGLFAGFILGVIFHRYVISEVADLKQHATNLRIHTTNEVNRLRGDLVTLKADLLHVVKQ